jgi:hypothetical protein
MKSSGREETGAIAAYLVSDGIDQCRIGFLQRHFVPHARSFDGVLARVTEVYSSINSEIPIKRKKCRHNMGCCLAALISELPAPAANTIHLMAPLPQASWPELQDRTKMTRKTQDSYKKWMKQLSRVTIRQALVH